MTSYIITTLKTLLIFIVNQSVTSFYTTDIDLFFKISFWQGLKERKTISLCKAVVEQVTTTQSLLSICCLLLRYCIFNLLCQSSVTVVSRWVVFFGGFFCPAWLSWWADCSLLTKCFLSVAVGIVFLTYTCTRIGTGTTSSGLVLLCVFQYCINLLHVIVVSYPIYFILLNKIYSSLVYFNS